MTLGGGPIQEDWAAMVRHERRLPLTLHPRGVP